MKRSKYSGELLPKLWKHPDLSGRLVAALDPLSAQYLVKKITMETLDINKFQFTGEYCWRTRIIPTHDLKELARMIPAYDDMIEDENDEHQ